LSTTKWSPMAIAFAFLSSTVVVAAQQSPLPTAPPEKIVPQSKELNSPASPGVTGSAATDGAGTARKDRAKEIDEGGRTGELQENRGRSDATEGAPFPPPSRDQNRVPNEKNSDRKL
jgi:hypothetical protein